MVVARAVEQFKDQEKESTNPSSLDLTYQGLINPLESGGPNLEIVHSMKNHLNRVSSDEDEDGNRIQYTSIFEQPSDDRQKYAEKIVEDYLDQYRYVDTNDVGMVKDLYWVLNQADIAKTRHSSYLPGAGEYTPEAIKAQEALKNYGYLRDTVMPALPGMFEKGGAPIVDGITDYAIEAATSASTIVPFFLGLVGTPVAGLAARAAAMSAQQATRATISQVIKNVMKTSASRVSLGFASGAVIGASMDAADQNKDIYIDMVDPTKRDKREFSYAKAMEAGAIEGGAGALLTIGGLGLSKLINKRAQARIQAGLEAGEQSAKDLTEKNRIYIEKWDSTEPMMGKTVQVTRPLDTLDADPNTETLVISNSNKEIFETGKVQLQRRVLDEDGSLADVEDVGTIDALDLNTGTDAEIPFVRSVIKEGAEVSEESGVLFDSPIQLRVLGGVEAKLSMIDELKGLKAKALDRQKAASARTNPTKFASDNDKLVNDNIIGVSDEALNRIGVAVAEAFQHGNVVRVEKFSITEQVAQMIENGTLDGDDLGDIFATHSVSVEDVAHIFRAQGSEAGRFLGRMGAMSRAIKSLEGKDSNFLDMSLDRRKSLNERAALYKEYEVGSNKGFIERFGNMWRMNLISGSVTTIRNAYGLKFQVIGQSGLRLINNVINASFNKYQRKVVWRDVDDIFDFKDLLFNTVNPRESLDLVKFAESMKARPELQKQLFGRMGDVIARLDENAKTSILTPFEKATQVANVLNLKFDEFTKSAAFHNKLKQQVNDAWDNTTNTPRYKVKVDPEEVTTEGVVGTGTFKQTLSKYPGVSPKDLYTVKEKGKDVLYRRLRFNDLVKENRMNMIEETDWEQSLYFTRDIMFQKRVSDYQGGKVNTGKGEPDVYLNTAPTSISGFLGWFLDSLTKSQKPGITQLPMVIVAPFARFAVSALDYTYRYTPGTMAFDMLLSSKTKRQLSNEMWKRGDFSRFGEQAVGFGLLGLALAIRLSAGKDPRTGKQSTIPGTDGLRAGQKAGSYILKDDMLVDTTYLFPMFNYDVLASFIVKLNPGGFTSAITGLTEEEVTERYGSLDNAEFQQQLVDVATQNLARGGGIVPIVKQYMDVFTGNDPEAKHEVETTLANFLGDFFGGFGVKFKELNDWYSLFEPETTMKRTRGPALPIAQKFFQSVYGVEGFKNLPKETREMLENPLVNKANVILSALTIGLPPLANKWLESELGVQEKYNLIKTIPDRSYGAGKHRTGGMYLGFDPQVSEELIRLDNPEYRLYNKVNIPEYDNAFRKIGSQFFSPMLKYFFNHRDYIEASDARKIRIIKAIKGVASAETRNVIIEYHPQLEMQRLVRLLSDTERREIFEKIRTEEGAEGKAWVENLNNINIYEHPGVVDKLRSYSEEIEKEWRDILDQNEILKKSSKKELTEARGGD